MSTTTKQSVSAAALIVSATICASSPKPPEVEETNIPIEMDGAHPLIPYVSIAAVNIKSIDPAIVALSVSPPMAAIKRPKFYSRLLDLFHHSPFEHQQNGLKKPLIHQVQSPMPQSPVLQLHTTVSNPAVSKSSVKKTGVAAPLQRLSRFLDFITPKGRLIPANNQLLIREERGGEDSPRRRHSPQSISEDEFEVLREQIGRSQEELEFSQKYRFIGTKVIGRGASGVVRLACCRSCTDRKLAVKEFRKRRKDESPKEYLRKLTSEFCIASRMHHSNVVETIDIVHDGSRWYEVMEYCPGGDLFSVIQTGRLGIDEIDCCFRQLVEGVSYLHSLGVAHRDLKPENLLIDQGGHLKIADFGVSDEFFRAEGCKSRGLCGSTPYIAPEEYLSEEYDGRLVDVWSVGIIYFAMIFHTIPWEAAHPRDPNYRAFIEGGPGAFEPFRRLAYGPRQLLMRILEADPFKRITIGEIMEDPWFQNIQTCHTIPVEEHEQ